jgi:2'-5' RNA ligase
MKHLYTVAYPLISDANRDLIEVFRSMHDPQRGVIAPHFTLMFGCNAVSEQEYLAHVALVAAQTRQIRFHCKYAMLGAGDDGETAHIFLVPDKGHSALSLLHDALYTGCLSPHLRLDLPYTPHITVGALKNRAHAKALCDELNGRRVDIEGLISTIHVGSLTDGVFGHHGAYALRA